MHIIQSLKNHKFIVIVAALSALLVGIANVLKAGDYLSQKWNTFFQNGSSVVEVTDSPITSLIAENKKYENLKIQLDSVHSDSSSNAWALREIKLFDHNKNEIPINSVDVSSCKENNPNCGFSNPSNVIDGIYDPSNQDSEPRVYWHPENIKDASDVGSWIALHFDKSSVERIELHQWIKDGCMRECSPAQLAAGEGRLRAYAKVLSLSFDGGREKEVVSLPDTLVVDIAI